MSGGDILAILQGAVVTVTLSLVGILIGLPIGLALAVLRWADVPAVARMVAVYVSILRATPLVTLLLLLFQSSFALEQARFLVRESGLLRGNGRRLQAQRRGARSRRW